MKKVRLTSLIIILLALKITASQAQVALNVDHFTGTGNVNLPLAQVQSRSLAYPVTLHYTTKGLKHYMPSGDVGTGWNLSAEGAIIRQVNDFPDDYKVGSDSRVGWLHNNVHTTVGNFTPLGDSDYSITADEESDYAALDNLTDAMPDIFYINVTGLSGAFFFDNQGQITFMDHRNYKVSYLLETASGDHRISSFSIVNDQGVTYNFDLKEVTTEQAVRDSSGITGAYAPDSVDYFIRYFMNFKEPVTYTSQWMLTTISSPAADSISFNYKSYEEDTLYTNDNIKVYLPKVAQVGSSTAELIVKKEAKVISYYLDEISSPFHTLKFVYNTLSFGVGGAVNLLNERKLTSLKLYSSNDDELINTTRFDYIDIRPGYYDKPLRTFLKRVSNYLYCNLDRPVEFDYQQVAIDTLHTPGSGGMPFWKGELTYNKTRTGDYWGYIGNHYPGTPGKYYYHGGASGYYSDYENPGMSHSVYINGYDGSPELALKSAGLISKVTLPDAGSMALFYEDNQFYDSLSASTQHGSGVRIKRTVQYDGQSHDNDIITRYDYAQGTLLYKPENTFMGSFNRGQTEVYTYSDYPNDPDQQVRSITLRTLHGLNDNVTGTPDIGYGSVKVTNPRGGYTLYKYALGTPYYDNDWPKTYIGLSHSSQIGRVAHSYKVGKNRYAYPYAPVKKDYTTGLLVERRLFNSANQTVGATKYTYSNLLSGASTAKAVKIDYMNEYIKNFDGNGDALLKFMVFSPYEITTGGDQAVSQQTHVSYNLAANDSIVSTTVYHRESALHPYVTKTVQTAADGQITETRMKYPQDYAVNGASSDAFIQGIDSLVLAHALSAPIERLSLIDDSGTLYVAGANLVSFNQNGNVEGSFALSQPKPLSAYTVSDTQSGGTVFIKDNAYELHSRTAFWSGILPETLTITKNGTSAATVYGFNGQFQVLKATLTGADELLFSDFESITSRDFELAGTFDEHADRVPGRYNGKAIKLHPSFLSDPATELTGAVNNITGEFTTSFWIKAGQSTNITAEFSDGLNTIAETLNIANTNGEWIEYSVDSDLATLQPEVSFKLFASNVVTVDDLLIRPTRSDYVHTNYRMPYGVAYVQNQNRTTAIYDYDQEGRLQFEKDGNGNILHGYEYSAANHQSISAFFSPEQVLVDEVPMVFTPSNTCQNGTYFWTVTDVANSTSFQTVGTPSLTYTFAHPGDFEIKLKVVVGSDSAVSSQVYAVDPRPLTIDFCAEGPKEIDLCQTNAITTFACVDIPGSPGTLKTDATKFLVTSVDSSLPLTYQWQFKRTDLGPTSSWSPVGTNQDNFDINFLEGGYQIRCYIMDTMGHEGWSDEIEIEVYESQTGCGQ